MPHMALAARTDAVNEGAVKLRPSWTDPGLHAIVELKAAKRRDRPAAAREREGVQPSVLEQNVLQPGFRLSRMHADMKHPNLVVQHVDSSRDDVVLGALDVHVDEIDLPMLREQLIE